MYYRLLSQINVAQDTIKGIVVLNLLLLVYFKIFTFCKINIIEERIITPWSSKDQNGRSCLSVSRPLSMTMASSHLYTAALG